MNHQQQLIELFGQHKSWEDRYRLILRLGKAHPRFEVDQQIDSVLLAGCESNVWFYGHYEQQSKQLALAIDSDAKIIRGLISIIISAHHGLSNQQVKTFDCIKFLERLGLLNHLSPSRGNGIRAIISAIRAINP